MKSLAILCVFYDGYQDVWEDFFNLFELNWPSCPYKKYIVNNSIDIKRDDFITINAGKDAEYSKKIQAALDVIEEDYILVLLEDFVIGKKIVGNPLEGVMNNVEALDADYYAMPLCEFNKSYKKKKAVIKKQVYTIKNIDGYTLNCQPSIWRKEFFKERIGTLNYNAWIFEGVYKLDNPKENPSYLQKCFCDKREPLNLVHTVVQQKIIPSAYNRLKKNGYVMVNPTRSHLTKSEEFKRNVRVVLSRIVPFSIKKALKRKRTNSVLGSRNEEIQMVRKDLGLSYEKSN